MKRLVGAIALVACASCSRGSAPVKDAGQCVVIVAAPDGGLPPIPANPGF